MGLTNYIASVFQREEMKKNKFEKQMERIVVVVSRNNVKFVVRENLGDLLLHANKIDILRRERNLLYIYFSFFSPSIFNFNCFAIYNKVIIKFNKE